MRDLFAEKLLTASVGVANFPVDGSDAEQLLAEADRRMYKKNARASKGQGCRTIKMVLLTATGRPLRFSSPDAT